ncbi:MAG: nitronate monooxygenase family protein [Elusimicrobia bacterium]|jgi:nitronate monooxygenase|nr:nitronate monooxygenase family protein [Elusimicrobiota bacterium]
MKNITIDDLTISVPVIQGGMGVGVSLSGLASAVANEGGVGVISATGIGMNEKDFYSDFMKSNKRILIKEIKKTREKSSGIIGVNLMVALTDYAELLATSYNEGVDMVFVGAGLPLKIPKTISVEEVKKSRTKFVPIVSSGRAANIIFRSWKKRYNYVPDAVVVEGPRAGGHLGFKKEEISSPDYSLENILPEVLNIIEKYRDEFKKDIPVIAAGGIYDGADIYNIIKKGANGTQMGTRFVATDECDASIKFKEAYIKAKKEDIEIIKSPVGLPGRAIKNEFLEKVNTGERQYFKCPCQCLKTCNFKSASYCIALALVNAKQGSLDKGFAFAGENVDRIDKIISVKNLFKKLKEEYSRAAKADGK